MNAHKKDFLIGLTITLFSVLLLTYIIPNNVSIPKNMKGISPALFPTIVSWIMLVFGVLLALQTLVIEPTVVKTCWKYVLDTAIEAKYLIFNVCITTVIITAFYLIMAIVRKYTNLSGYLFAAPICSFALGKWFRWENNISLMFIAATTTCAIYLIFQIAMQIKLP